MELDVDATDLARRAARGDERSFAALVHATSTRLYRLCARLLGDAAEAEDVTQEVYLNAHTALRRGRFDERARVETWLYRIATNASLNALRARRGRASKHAAALELAQPSEDGARHDARLALSELGRWMDALPPDQRVALVLKEIEGHTCAEVADIMNISEGAAEQRLVRARATLRALKEGSNG